MSETLWDRFDGIAGRDDVEKAMDSFTPIEEGMYDAVLEKIEAGESKSGLPMLKAQFRTTTNRVVFVNQVLQNVNYPDLTSKNIAEAVLMLEGILDTNIVFESLGQLALVVASVNVGGKYTIEIKYGKNDFEKSFPKVKILEMLEEPTSVDDLSDEDVPF